MIIWLDLETTGLNPRRDDILELGMVITDDDLSEVARKSWVLKLSPYYPLSDFIRQMHTESGLLEDCHKSSADYLDTALNAAAWLQAHGIEAGKHPMAGNTIGFDRSFLAAHMPKFLEWFHYRSIDMSSVSELAKRWAPTLHAARPDCKAHRALADLDNSIALARYYRPLFQLGECEGCRNFAINEHLPEML